jgi:hypothetical protein|eukprot:CAMPEP_0113389078 /NCGR_PEP_ID=MMETSP0013_2-20120614/9428_1 /TAXON_ID=2843 ORGANISM="Skeletonema costatum, Strain 1716" /NCGR_SAMPLE_ID=MMETSP0013_2 /ASSEMBLY_ACC=CAM_ASM_000158 /LENGTH=82 /DNA_ID=CAMNT_0000272117 /DNA_START=504 /DNA_END=752 /DNA_ORIENTATION=- /assembly_acc=CAM_ASM_000158
MAWHADGKLEVAFDCDAIFQRSYRVIQTRNGSFRIWMWMCGFGLSRATRKNAETRAKQAGVFTQIHDAMNRGRTGKVRTTKL